MGPPPASRARGSNAAAPAATIPADSPPGKGIAASVIVAPARSATNRTVFRTAP